MDKLIKKNKIASSIIALIIILWLAMMATDTRILLSEKKIEPGQEYYVSDYGNLGDNSQASLVCRYFNGRKVLIEVFWYEASNIFGRDSCPFLSRG